MIYIIDHQDSFTHNVVHQFEGFDNVICDNYNEINENKLNSASVIVLSPGPGEPKNYPISSNIYTGSFGYIKFNGDMRFNIIIRSILNYKNRSEISVASGVVIDSNAKHEFNENYIKAKALIDLYK